MHECADVGFPSHDRIGRAILTYFPPSSDTKFLEPEFILGQDIHRLSNWWSQYERCPETQRLHIHAYAEFKQTSRPRFNILDAIFKSHDFGWDCRTARKASAAQRQGAINYVHKFESRLDSVQPFTWSGNVCDAKFDPTFVPLPKKSKRKSRDDEIETMRLYIA